MPITHSGIKYNHIISIDQQKALNRDFIYNMIYSSRKGVSGIYLYLL